MATTRRTRSQYRNNEISYKEKANNDFTPDVIDSEEEDTSNHGSESENDTPVWLQDKIDSGNSDDDVNLDSDVDGDDNVVLHFEEYLDKNNENSSKDENSDMLEGDDKTSLDLKLKKLDEFVKQSKVYSSIISDTLLQRAQERQVEHQKTNDSKVIDESSNEVPRKKKRKMMKNIVDFFKKDKKKEEDNEEITNDSSIIPTSNEITTEKEAHLKGQPTLLKNCILKNYQFEGLNWLITLYENGLNGILADDMGLGKTIQSIGLLTFIYEMDTKGPFLIAAPLSTIDNWINEFNKFAPDLPVLKYYSNQGQKSRENMLSNFFKKTKHTGIIVTSYEMIVRDANHIMNEDWKFLIVDEGHRLKNINCKLIQQLKLIKTSNRLLLTGTPLQNNLAELWSLLNFIMPDIFADFEIFNKWFDFSNFDSDNNNNGNNNINASEKINKIINDELEKNLISNLHSILKPFLLRRLKKVVLADILPPKREYLVNCPLTVSQKKFYLRALQNKLKVTIFKEYLKEFFTKNTEYIGQVSNKSIRDFIEYKSSNNQELIDKFSENGLIQNMDKLYNKHIYLDFKNKKIQNLLMQLRQIVDSTYTMYFPFLEESDMTLDELLKTSGKLQVLQKLSTRLISNGHKILIFSQFAKVLDLLEDWVELNNFKCCRIDGTIKNEDRKEEIEKFNDPKGKYNIFLLSTRSGGLGINLTAADSVVIFDSDWNPQVDLQAMDRSHRIGQDKPVIVYRFFCDKTIENLILTRAYNKRRLEKLVIQMGHFNNLKKLALNEKSFLQTSANNAKRNKISNKELVDELALLLKSDISTFTTSRDRNNKKHNKESTVLSDEEIDELTDRSKEAYAVDRKALKFPNITLFETSTDF